MFDFIRHVRHIGNIIKSYQIDQIKQEGVIPDLTHKACESFTNANYIGKSGRVDRRLFYGNNQTRK